jgi:CRISPR-associated protein Cas2
MLLGSPLTAESYCMFIVVTYDITDDKRRLKISDELQNFGARVNFSVFECHLEKAALSTLKDRLAKLLEPAEDNIRYYVLCDDCVEKVEIQGKGGVTPDSAYVIV